MPKIQFKTKPETIYNMDGTPAYVRVKVPTLTSKHCDMHEFRTHKRFGAFANSDMFPSMLKRAALKAGIGPYIRLDNIPDHTTIDTSGFLATITIDLEA